VEVRFNDLSVEAECQVVHGKPIPTLWNTIKGSLSVSTQMYLLLPSDYERFSAFHVLYSRFSAFHVTEVRLFKERNQDRHLERSEWNCKAWKVIFSRGISLVP